MLHWNALKKILWYHKSTILMGIQYDGKKPFTLLSYSDVSHIDDRKSRMKYVYLLGSRAIS